MKTRAIGKAESLGHLNKREALSDEHEWILAEGAKDPVTFIREALQAKLWKKQQEIAYAVRDYRRVAIKACNSSGKSFLIGRIILWWNFRYPEDGKVLITAGGWQQVKNIAAVEYQTARMNAHEGIKPYLPDLNANVVAKDDIGRPIVIGLAPKNAVRMQGHHAGHILIVVDEASSPDVPWDAIEGNLAGGEAHIVLLGNPTIPSGYFYDAFHGANAVNFHQITIDGFDTPNLEGFSLETLRALPSNLTEDVLSDPNHILSYEPHKGLTTRWWVYEKYRSWGEEHPEWQSRVRGQFPTEAVDSVFPLSWLRAAQTREPIELPPSEHLRVGIDVAGVGHDELVVYRTRGGNIQGFSSWRTVDPKDGKNLVLADLAKLDVADIDNVAVDFTGPGMYFAPWIEEAQYPVQRVQFGEKAIDDKQFANRKAELYWHTRGLFKDGLVAGLIDEMTIQQLAGARYEIGENGRVQIETKEKAKKRGVPSPDRAEALILALANTEPSFLIFYREQARRLAHKEQTLAPGEPVPAEAPKPRIDTTYQQTMAKLTGGISICHACKQQIKGSRIEQGQYRWCIPCAQQRGMA